MEHYTKSISTTNDAQQLVVLTRLLQEVVRMHHVDDLFCCLTETIVQQLHMETAQIWTRQILPTHQQAIALRASSLRDPSMSQYSVINPHIMQIVAQLLSQQQNTLLQPVGNLFTHYQSNLLKRYGLNYCACCFTAIDVVMPASLNTDFTVFREYGAQQETSGPIIIGLLIFMAQPRSQAFLNVMHAVLRQAIYIGKKQHLLQEPPPVEPMVSVEPLPPPPPLYQLIPMRTRLANSMVSSSPLTSTVTISNKSALVFLSAIDGTRTVAEIAVMKRIVERDLMPALRQLLELGRIQMYSKDGQLIKKEVLAKIL